LDQARGKQKKNNVLKQLVFLLNFSLCVGLRVVCEPIAIWITNRLLFGGDVVPLGCFFEWQ
jgi:hypothetical protein